MLPKILSIDTVAISDEILWGGAPGKDLNNLSRCPFCSGVVRHVEMEAVTSRNSFRDEIIGFQYLITFLVFCSELLRSGIRRRQRLERPGKSECSGSMPFT
jgi:hypothetical protein